MQYKMIKLKNILLEEPGTKQTISNLRDGAKVWNGIYNATLDWKKHLVDVGATTVTSTGKKRNELNNPEWDNLPNWLKGDGSHPYGDRIWLWPQAGRAFLKMKSAAAVDGVTIIVTNAYRDVFHQALVKDLNTNGKTGLPVAALGKSNHGFGLAIDVSRGAGREWMIKNGLRYGWSWFGSGDLPHFNYYPILLANNLRFGSDVSKRKLQRYLKKSDKKMAKIVLPDIQTAVEKAKTTPPTSTRNHYNDIESSPDIYNYPILSSSNFEAWKDSIDKKTNIPFYKINPIVLVGNIDSADTINTKEYNPESKQWKTKLNLLPSVTINAKK